MTTRSDTDSHRARLATAYICLLAALAGLMFGLDIGVISGAVQFIQADFQVSDHMIEWIVSAMMAGAAIGALCAGWLSASLGRKRSLILAAVLFVIGSVLCALAVSPVMLIGARLVLGLAIGVATFTAPLYLAEVSSQRSRGAMVSTYQLMITIGILAAFLSDLAFSHSESWRWMLGVIAIPGALFLIGVLTLPESPRWLLMRGRGEEATTVLRRLRGDDQLVQKEIGDIKEQLKTKQHGFSLFRRNRNFRRSVGLGILLQVMQQLTGMNVVMYYAPTIFEGMGYATTAQLWFTAIVGLVNVLATFIAIGFVDKLGRKPILYAGFAVMTVGMGVVGIMMHLGIATNAEQLFTVAMLLVFIVGFAMSAGPLIWTLCSEVQPLNGRDFGIGCSTFTNWIANMIVGATFLTLLNTIGDAATFWLYAALNALFLVFTFLLVPETKGVSLEQIERNLMSGLPLRDIGRH
ncbi:MAG TPA: sugar porter family MFS transporter [Oleiagrimonas sp.]|nr:sugar porter family MFS transporter [Oleiagrimonas sp.]